MKKFESSATEYMRENVKYEKDNPIFFDYIEASGPDGIQFDSWYSNEYLKLIIDRNDGNVLNNYAVPSRAGYLNITEVAMIRNFRMDINLPSTVLKHEYFHGEPLGKTVNKNSDVNFELKNSFIYPAFLNPPENEISEVSRWYEEEHLPILMGCSEWLMTRRFKIINSQNCKYSHLAIHYLKDLRTLRSKQRDDARQTPWRDHLIEKGWFSPEYRVCYPIKTLPI